jgi:hypothetical protein
MGTPEIQIKDGEMEGRRDGEKRWRGFFVYDEIGRIIYLT